MDTDLGNDQAAVKVTKVAKLGPVSEEAMVTDSGDTNQTSISSLRAQQVLKAKQAHLEQAAWRESFKFGVPGSVNNWEALPEQILSTVVSKCGVDSILNGRLVCKRWNYHFSAGTKALKPEKLNILHRIGAEFGSLRRLDLTRCTGLRNRQVEKLVKSKVPIQQLLLGSSLTANSATFAAAQITNQALLTISEMKSLEYLALSHLAGITDAGIKAVCTMSSLKHLLLSNCRRITTGAFEGVAALTNLTTFEIHACSKIQGTVLDSLKDCCALERISFEGGSFNIQGQVQNLKSLPKLKILELSRCSLSEECVRQLMELTNLTGLGFYEAAVPSVSFLLEQMKPTFQGLQHLNLKGLGVMDDEVLNSLPTNFPFLQDLKFDLGRDNTGTAVEAMANLQHLTSLTMSSLYAPDDCLSALSRLTNLQVLELPGTHIPQTLLEALISLQKLEKLGLRRGHVDAAEAGRLKSQGRKPLTFTPLPILAFAQFKSLRALDLSQTTITYHQVVELISKMLDKNGSSTCNLEEVILQGCSIAPEGFTHLREMFPSVICKKEEVVRLRGSTLPWDAALFI